jgi:hypothetical protein
MKNIFFSKVAFAIYGIWITLGIFSCSPEIYNANALNVPLLSKRGNAKVSLGTSFPYNNNLQSAYAVSDHVGLMLNGMYHDFKRTYTPFLSSTSRTDRHVESFIEAGLGYYSTIGNSSRWRWECYGGYGIGKSKETNPNNSDALILTSPYNRLFIQPSIGFVSPYFEAALSIRGSYLSVGAVNWSGNAVDGKILRGFNYEPSLTIKAGLKSIKPFIQYSWFIPDSGLNPVIDIGGFINRFLGVQVGVCIGLNE